jgi:hypothetical protein
MKAYHNDPQIKTSILAVLAAHRAADEIVKGQYWQNGKGCAVGCTIKSDNHIEYEADFGIPVMLAYLEDTIFEGLPNADAKLWPERFMSAIKPGADLSNVGWKFLHWLLTDEAVNPGINDPSVKDFVTQCADIVFAKSEGRYVDTERVWMRRVFWSGAPETASSAARAAAAVRWAETTADADVAARKAAMAAWSVAATEDAYVLMADKLLALISECEAAS